ncbi:MAG: tRNA pseudouridine(38-40) synthase TruA [Candidatus Melainabacteria bacterium]|nr:tRNA pseudouridine(38-40) synthase TruA [Candidatus Melainabacteria bacterium]
MPRLAFLIEYHGKKISGSQFQLGVRTVQAELEAACKTLGRKEMRVHLSGRTDAGVHASGQVGHVDWPDTGEKDLDLWRMAWALNGILKSDISIVDMQLVDETFHARYRATSREYVYRFLNRAQRSVFLKDTHYLVHYPLDVEAMQDGASRLLGRHDFSSFRSTGTSQSSPICTVTRSELLQLGDGRLEFWIAADHFVYNMVRIIAGTLTEIGLGKRTPDSVENALEKSDRDLAGPTAPPWGLTLYSVSYPQNYNLFERDPSQRRLKEFSREDL